ncbi:transposase [Candidatus Rickettsiella viridis]|uniref:transposase n=1 Tax=Candidatus Rickettsiella viridis TaxID=676208 RepID=UPI000F830ECF
MFDGYCDSLLFETYLEQCSLPKISLGNTIIAYNAAFHKSVRAKALVHLKACELIFLAPYSPDLNSIEHLWFPIKNKTTARSKRKSTALPNWLSYIRLNL